jgi:hypothetical protein
MTKFLLLICLSGYLISCAQGNCRQNQKVDPEEQARKAEEIKKISNNTDRVRIFKYDGSLQCGMGAQKPLDAMKKELGKIPTYEQENKPDGLMHIQMCGQPTGRANVYLIDRKDLAAAIKLGFKEWLWE